MPLGGEIAKRELHFFFVCDCSGSMSVDGKIDALNQAIRVVIPEMQKVAAENPNAAVKIRVLRFSDQAVWHIAEPIALEQFRWDKDMSADGLTRLDKALDLLTDAFKDPNLPTHMLLPVILLISDGQPSERWQSSWENLISTFWGGRAIRLAVAIGRDADRDVLQDYIGNVEIKVQDANSPQALVAMIRWLSTEALRVSTKSKAAGAPDTAFSAPAVEDSGDWLD